MIVREVGTTIRTGAIGATLLRPASYPLMLLAEQIGARLFEWVVIGLPVIVVMGAIYGMMPQPAWRTACCSSAISQSPSRS